MERTITCGKHLCQTAVIDDSRFDDVGMARTEFDNVSLADAKFNNVNMSGATFHGIELRNAKFTHVGLNDVELSDCTLEGTRINGILVTDMLEAYQERQASAT
jgi:uncharacterized protein YjbI with pentapeptide repeats